MPEPETPRASAAAARKFFDAHMANHPEEASTLGVRDHDHRLCDPSPAAARTELSQLRESLGEVVELIAASPSELDLDLDAVVRVAKFHVRRIEEDADASNLELAALPNDALQHAALHARSEDHWAALCERARSVPSYLQLHTDNLRRGVKEGRAPDEAVARAFAERILPRIAQSITTLGATAKARGASDQVIAKINTETQRASETYKTFTAFVASDVVPKARLEIRLGEDEVTRRLHDTMGVTRSIFELIASAKQELGAARARIDEETRAMGKTDPSTTIKEICSRNAETVDEALALYRKFGAAATDLVRDRKLMPVPDPLALDLVPLPPGLADGGCFTNWPAPLLDPRGSGHALYSEIEPHPLVQAKNLAVHEGIPGHYLQSVAWQRMKITKENREHAVRWIGVADPVAMSRAYFGAMVSIEGWAVYTEQLLRENDFYDRGPETLFFAVCDAIRATRVLLDLELQAGDMSTEELVRMVNDSTLMPSSWGEYSVLRAKRVPLQGLTYLVGAQETMNLRARRPKSESLYDFHARLFQAGPVPLSRLGV